MVRHLAPLAIALLLSGCTSPASPAAHDARPASALPAVAASQVVHEFWGNLTGVGVVSPQQTSFLGVSTQGQSFGVGVGATRLAATLTWDRPADLYLDIDGPDGQVTMLNSLTGPIERSVTFETTAVPAGSWSVHAWAQGPAVVTYHIGVTVDRTG